MLNYGFIVENNDSNEFPFIVELTPSHAYYTYKLNFMTKDNNNSCKKTFRVQENFNENMIQDFFSYMRFVYFDEDINNLINVITKI